MTDLRYAGKPVAEWLVWIAIAGIAYSQTGHFDMEIKQYAFGADGWPTAICIGLVLGATGQLIYQLTRLPRSFPAASPGAAVKSMKLLPSRGMAQRVAIFMLPFVFLYLTPIFGAYVSVPLFVLAMLILLDVRSPRTLIGVTAIIYAVLLLVFTRIFYVALPTGRIDLLYEFNTALIVLSRMGL